MTELCEMLAGHSATTLWVTKEALRRAREVPEGDDLVREAYGSDGRDVPRPSVEASPRGPRSASRAQ